MPTPARSTRLRIFLCGGLCTAAVLIIAITLPLSLLTAEQDSDATDATGILGQSQRVSAAVPMVELTPAAQSNGQVSWHTYLGSANSGDGDTDAGVAVAVDDEGHLYVAGHSSDSWGAPEASHAGGTSDGFVAKHDLEGNLLWHTFLGSGSSPPPAGTDALTDIAVDPAGNVFVSGLSFASWGSPIRSHAGGQDGFVAKLSPAGVLLWHAFIGGTGSDELHSLAIDSAGQITLAGQSDNGWGTPVNTYAGGKDGFVARLDANGVLLWSTFMGASSADDSTLSIAVNQSGETVATGRSEATWGSPVQDFAGGTGDGFVARFDSAGTRVWTTFVGGPGDPGGTEGEQGNDALHDVTFHPSGDLVVAGFSDQTWGTPVEPHVGVRSPLVARLTISGTLQWHTFTGYTPGDDQANAVVALEDGRILLAGYSDSPGSSMIYSFAVMDILDGDGDREGPLLGPNSFPYILGTTTGTTSIAADVAVNQFGTQVIVGRSDDAWSGGYPATGSPIRPFSGGLDAFLAAIDVNGIPDGFEASFGDAGVSIDTSGSSASVDVLGSAQDGSEISFFDLAVSLPPGTQLIDSSEPLSITFDYGSYNKVVIQNVALPMSTTKSVRLRLRSDREVCIEDTDTATVESVSEGACGPPPPFPACPVEKFSVHVPELTLVTIESKTLFPECITATYTLSPSGSIVTVDGLLHTAVAAQDSNANSGQPVVGAISTVVDPVVVGTELEVAAGFRDVSDSGVHTAVWDWGDGTTATCTGTSATCAIDQEAHSATGSHVYEEAGVYPLTLTIGDTGGLEGTSEQHLVVVYDPDGGFVTGGGWIDSPPGALSADPRVSGKAHFGFVSKYHNGANTPSGDTNFTFKAGDLVFASSDYDWLVVAGQDKAKFKGTGTINDQGFYSFVLTVRDAGNRNDTFRIRIWDSGGTVYDNLLGESDTQYLGTEIGGGSIKVHKP